MSHKHAHTPESFPAGWLKQEHGLLFSIFFFSSHSCGRLPRRLLLLLLFSCSLLLSFIFSALELFSINGSLATTAASADLTHGSNRSHSRISIFSHPWSKSTPRTDAVPWTVDGRGVKTGDGGGGTKEKSAIKEKRSDSALAIQPPSRDDVQDKKFLHFGQRVVWKVDRE